MENATVRDRRYSYLGVPTVLPRSIAVIGLCQALYALLGAIYCLDMNSLR
jgi:hypothetical protein